MEFIEQINNAHSKIQFIADWSNRSIAFLDVKVTIEEGPLTTDLLTKPTNRHQCLHNYSCHPAHCTSTIVYSQASCLRWICSNSNTYLRRAKELEKYLVSEGIKGKRSNNRSRGLPQGEADQGRFSPVLHVP